MALDSVCVRGYGPGKLSTAEENQYWEECAIAAQLQTCDPADIMMPPTPALFKPIRWAVNKVMRAATIATMPQWMGGLRQSRWTDALVTPLMRVSFRIIHLSSRVELAALGLLSPGTVPVVAPILRGVRPINPEVITPAEARARYSYDRPSEAHLELRARQARRVLGEGQTPSDEGLLESEPVLGMMA